MQLSNIPSSHNLPGGNLRRSGMAGFLDSLLTTVGNYETDQTNVSIANTQAQTQVALATAAAQQTAITAATNQASTRSNMTMLLLAAAVGGGIYFLRSRKGH